MKPARVRDSHTVKSLLEGIYCLQAVAQQRDGSQPTIIKAAASSAYTKRSANCAESGEEH
jgi:hypothetical protein